MSRKKVQVPSLSKRSKKMSSNIKPAERKDKYIKKDIQVVSSPFKTQSETKKPVKAYVAHIRVIKYIMIGICQVIDLVKGPSARTSSYRHQLDVLCKP